MYLPILRGRQFELLSLRECITRGLLSDKVIPVIEPVKASATLLKAMETFADAGRRIAIIYNPQVGNFAKELKKEDNQRIREGVASVLKDPCIVSALYVDSDLNILIDRLAGMGIDYKNTILICNMPDNIKYYESVMGEKKALFTLIPDKRVFRRSIRGNRVLCEDHFPKRPRNVDYQTIESEFFSNDHLYYSEDGYIGFSDYSVVGDDYSETGFAPYAVAIHIVYFDESESLRIAHFVSDSNDDISDPARKFAEAAEKLIRWNRIKRLDTFGIRAIEEAYKNQTYPGLGVVKKYSIMHHLELISTFLDRTEQ